MLNGDGNHNSILVFGLFVMYPFSSLIRLYVKQSSLRYNYAF